MKSSTAQKTQIETGASFSPHYKTRSFVARSSNVGSSKTTAQKSASARISKCKGKSAALSLPGPSVSGKNSASTVRFDAPNVVGSKENILNHVASNLIREKSLQSFLEKDVIGHIRADEDICSDHPIKPLGVLCQLCKLDLSFMPKIFSESFRAKELPTAAVLSCGHCYHTSCLEDVFGTVEPPCITCLDC